MCGIVGIFGLIDKTRIGMFEDMLAMDGVRGKDSTGIAVISPKSATVVKDSVLADKLLDSEAYKLAKKGKALCLIGHNRAATLGKVIKENAHPFQYKHITLVHNGTLDNRWRLPDWWKYDSDTEALTRCIADHGIETTWKVIEGAATLVWWDSNAQTLNVLSNGKRPFFMQPLKNSDGMVWSSERWTLLTAALRSGVEFAKVEKIYTPIADKLYSFKWLAAQKMFTFEEKQLQIFKFGNTIPGYHAYNPAWDQTPSKKKKKSKNKRSSGTAGVIKSAAESASVFQEWKGRYVERKADNEEDTPFSDQDYSDAALRGRYPELFDPALSGLPGAKQQDGSDADLDTRAVPFRGKASEKNVRTAERFKQLFDLVDLNAKHFTHEWFLITYGECCECGASFNYNDYFTSRVLKEGTAICDLCQMDAWVISGIEPDQIRLQ